MLRSAKQPDRKLRVAGAGWMLVGLVVAALLVGVVLYVPRWLYPPLSAAALPGVAADRRVELETNRLRLQSDSRATLVQGLAGLAVFAGAAIGWRQYRHTIQTARLQHDLDRSGQITERFTRAIDQLGRQEQLEIVLGGIYALERIARDSLDDRATVAEILTAYIRTHASWPPLPPNPYGVDVPINELPPLRGRAPDVQAAVTVLGRGSFPAASPTHLILGAVDLRKATLTDANLQGVDLTGAQLQEANLQGAQLQGAELQGAQLQGAELQGAQLEEAFVFGAQLQDANLAHAQLARAVLSSAQLQEANLVEADLRGAQMSSTELQGAFLIDAQLQGATLDFAKLNEASLERAQLQRADLFSADLQEANLSGAQLQEAVLSRANLSSVTFTGEFKRSSPPDFAGAKASSETVWPDGFDAKTAGVVMVEEAAGEMEPG
jgi:uncharacterized protein YjbI with pentapeptide repeats